MHISSKLSRLYRCSNISEDSRVTLLNDTDYQIVRMQINKMNRIYEMKNVKYFTQSTQFYWSTNPFLFIVTINHQDEALYK